MTPGSASFSNPPTTPEDPEFSETISVFETEVDVNQLRKLSLDADVMKRPASRILGLNKTWVHQEQNT